MKRAELKEYYQQQNLRRFIQDVHFGWPPGDASAIQQKLREYPDGIVEMECFNDVDAEIIREALTPEEQKRVRFKYLFRIPEDTEVAINKP